MDQTNPNQIKVGMVVVFEDKVFSPPYTPYYDSYKGHIFEVLAFHEGDHVKLKCVDDPSVAMQGYPHADELTPSQGYLLGEIMKRELVREQLRDSSPNITDAEIESLLVTAKGNVWDAAIIHEMLKISKGIYVNPDPKMVPPIH